MKKHKLKVFTNQLDVIYIYDEQDNLFAIDNGHVPPLPVARMTTENDHGLELAKIFAGSPDTLESLENLVKAILEELKDMPAAKIPKIVHELQFANLAIKKSKGG